MGVVLLYLFFVVLIIIMNASPGLMPATWMVISFFVIKYDLSILPTVIFGALAATVGRVLLANFSKKYVRPHLPLKQRLNLTALGKFLTSNKKVSIPLLVGYAFLPIPSNQVFIALGLSGVDFNLIAGSFFAGRLISYAFWVKLADHLADDLGTLVSSGWKNPTAVIFEVLGILGIVLVMMVPWTKILRIEVEEEDLKK